MFRSAADLARAEIHPIIKASRGFWFHRFREIWRLCENVILSFHTTSTYWDSTNKQTRLGVNNFCQNSWWIVVGLFKQAVRPTGWSPVSIVCFRSSGPVWLSAEKKRRNSQKVRAGECEAAEAAEASTYDSSGVFGFHAVGRFLSGLFEAFFSLFEPKKDQDAH